MSEFEDEYPYEYEELEAYYEQPASPADQLTQAFYENPAETISAIAGAAAELRAQQIAQQTSSQIQAAESQYAGQVAAQSGTLALNRLTELYGQDFQEAKPMIADYISARPHLVNADYRDPNVTFDVLHAAYESVKNDVQREKNANAWDEIKNVGKLYYSDGR